MKKYYLAHPLVDITLVQMWQKWVEGNYDIKLLNPFFNNKLEDGNKLKKINTLESSNNYQKTLTEKECSEIMWNDIDLIKSCDGIVAILTPSAVGTTMEIFYCAFVLKKPIYIITKEFSNHCWLRALVTRAGGAIFESQAEFEDTLEVSQICRI